MDSIRELVLNMVVCMILINIVEMMIASNILKKYIKLFCGFILIMVVVSHSKGLIDNMDNYFYGKSVKYISKDASRVYSKTNNEIKRISNIMNQKEEKYVQEYIKNTYKDIENIIINTKKTDEIIDKVVLKLDINKKQKENRIKNSIQDIKIWVCKYFNIMEEQVEIKTNQ